MNPLSDAPAGSTSSTPSDARKDSDASSEQRNQATEDAASGQATATVSPFLLPIELLVEIFRYLSTNEVARSAQACRTWHAASQDVRIWRHISFTRPGKPALRMDYPVVLPEEFKTFSARSGNTIESVDFADYAPLDLGKLTRDLLVSAQTVKHVRMLSSGGYKLFPVHAVADFARRCPQLETLELRVELLTAPLDTGWQNDLSDLARPRIFSFTVDYRADCFTVDGRADFGLFAGDAAILDRATIIDIKYVGLTSFAYGQRLLEFGTLHRLLSRNPTIERLTVHGLVGDWPDDFSLTWSDESFSLIAPSLTLLDLLYSTSWGTEMRLDAPKLRELVIEAHLLRNFTPASTAQLSSLTLRFADSDIDELGAIDSIKHHQGYLKLSVVASGYPERILGLLSEDILWPGLEEVEILLTGAEVHQLVSVMAARCIGARGASSEQYLDTVRKRSKELQDAMQLPDPDLRDSTVVAVAQEAMAAARTSLTDGAASLCSHVQWKIYESHNNTPSERVLQWLEEQPNVAFIGEVTDE